MTRWIRSMLPLRYRERLAKWALGKEYVWWFAPASSRFGATVQYDMGPLLLTNIHVGNAVRGMDFSGGVVKTILLSPTPLDGDAKPD